MAKPVKTAKDLSPNKLGMIRELAKTYASPNSTAGKLRDRNKELDKKLKKAGV